MFRSVLDALQHLDQVERLAKLSGLTRRAVTAFLLVERAGGVERTQTVLRDMKISGPALCRALDNLGDQGLVIRSRDEDNWRKKFIKLTDKGLDFAYQLRGR